MPKKAYFERDLVDIRITRKCHTYLMTLKKHGQPMYSLIDHVVGSYKDNSQARAYEELYNNQLLVTQGLVAKLKIAEDKLAQMSSIMVQGRLDEHIG